MFSIDDHLESIYIVISKEWNIVSVSKDWILELENNSLLYIKNKSQYLQTYI